MEEKYDLNKMLAEIDADDGVGQAEKKTARMTQEEIRKMLMQKKNEKKERKES